MLAPTQQNISIFTIWLFSLSAIIGIYLGYLDWFIPKTPLNLLLGTVLLFLNLPLDTLRKFGIWFIAFAVGMLAEIIGVRTGIIFGAYYYGENFGIKLLGVPLLIGVNWAVLSFITSAIATRLTKNIWGSVFIGAALMLGLDFLMEPVAGIFDFWHFEGENVPWRNYTDWFVIALLLQILIQKTIDFSETKYALHLFFTQVFFFGTSYLLLLA